MIQITLLKEKKIIIETLSRIGIANESTKTLYPSCYYFEDESGQYIAHFKEMFEILNKDYYSNISDNDIKRLNAIVFNLKRWGMIDADDEEILNRTRNPREIFVLPYYEKKIWKIKNKIHISY